MIDELRIHGDQAAAQTIFEPMDNTSLHSMLRSVARDVYAR